jgi:tetratricopeptide (TPR) repeat protein
LDHANLREALTWALAVGDHCLALRLGESLWEFWYVRGYVDEGEGFLLPLLLLDPPEAKPSRAWVALGAGTIGHARGDSGRASELHADAFARFELLGNARGMGASLSNRAIDLAALGDRQASYEAFTRGLAILRSARDERMIGYLLNNYGVVLTEDGRYEEAVEALEESLEILERIPTDGGPARSLARLPLPSSRPAGPRKPVHCSSRP